MPLQEAFPSSIRALHEAAQGKHKSTARIIISRSSMSKPLWGFAIGSLGTAAYLKPDEFSRAIFRQPSTHQSRQLDDVRDIVRNLSFNHVLYRDSSMYVSIWTAGGTTESGLEGTGW